MTDIESSLATVRNEVYSYPEQMVGLFSDVLKLPNQFDELSAIVNKVRHAVLKLVRIIRCRSVHDRKHNSC